MSKLFSKLTSVVPALALVMAVASANAACFCFLHQPDIPASLRKYDQ
jgi:cyclic lactone autoinducer peptide